MKIEESMVEQEEEEEEEYEHEIEDEEAEKEEEEEEEEAIGKQITVNKEIAVLEFMDSMHNYLSLLHSLSSTLSHAWMDLASARLSMGSSRINTTLLFHLHPHSAPTTCLFSVPHFPRFTLRKWLSSSHHQLNQHNDNKPQEDGNTLNSNELTVAQDFSGPANDEEEEVRKERSKSLSVFGILISPKLRDAQLSFEKALETLVEIANMRSSLLYSFHQLHQDAEDTKE